VNYDGVAASDNPAVSKLHAAAEIMTSSPASFRGLVVFLLCLTGFAASLDAQSDFFLPLNESGLTSAGIFDSNGYIVRTLWALETFNAGNLSGSWDGLDDFGTPVPPGSYTWKVIRNGALYNNIGVIGNTGLPPVTSGHVPFFIEGVAVDAQGKPIRYTTGTSLILT
jgi:hypothetical protein